MAERAINQRKAPQTFLSGFAPISASLDELVKDKLECGQFPLTKTGWIKIIAMLVILAGLALFLAQNWDTCSNLPDWYTKLFPICAGANAGVILIFYLFFSCGLTVKHPGKWDIIINLVFALVGIIGSAITMTQKVACTENTSFHSIPIPLGLVGSVLSIVGCGAIFLLYRYVDEEDAPEVSSPEPLQRNNNLRMSMHA